MADAPSYLGFIGNYVNRVDAKGRVSVPARFRERLGKVPLVCMPAFHEPAIQAGGEAMAAALRETVARLPQHSRRRAEVELALYAGAEELKFDDGGRVQLPASLRAHAGIEGDARFIGMGDWFHIWSPARFDARRTEAEAEARRLLARMNGDDEGADA